MKTNKAVSHKRYSLALCEWWCPEQDSNLHVSQHSHLKRARLPFRHLGISFGRRAENEARTRDPDLGKVVLYQLSYFRICFFCEEKETRTPTTQLSLPPQSSASTNSAISPRLSEVCPGQDSNLHVSQHSHLKRARLPFRHLGISFGRRAENEARTRDPDLGKVVLYQLSYFRVYHVILPECVAKVRLFFESANFSGNFLQKKAENPSFFISKP